MEEVNREIFRQIDLESNIKRYLKEKSHAVAKENKQIICLHIHTLDRI